jgi:hypothetical protein
MRIAHLVVSRPRGEAFGPAMSYVVKVLAVLLSMPPDSDAWRVALQPDPGAPDRLTRLAWPLTNEAMVMNARELDAMIRPLLPALVSIITEDVDVENCEARARQILRSLHICRFFPTIVTSGAHADASTAEMYRECFYGSRRVAHARFKAAFLRELKTGENHTRVRMI